MSEHALFEIVNNIENIESTTEKLRFIINDAYDRTNPTDANQSEEEQAINALFEQPNLSTELGIALDYIHQVIDELRKVEDASTFIWKSSRSENKETVSATL